jgi:SAM-dependent methyltransferase
MKVSAKHTNRRYHNWLLYKIGDGFRKKYSHLYKGDMYDLGCGEAPYKEYFLKFADRYIGVDWSNTVYNSGADIVSDLNKKIDLEDEVADTVVTISVMEHLHEPQLFLSETFRIMKKGGNLILQVPWQWHIHEGPHDYYRYTPYGLQYLLEKAGFTVHEIVPTTGFFTTQAMKWNYFTRRFIRGPKILRFIISMVLIPLWFVAQLIAPYLDKLDRNRSLESQGYYVHASK